MRQWCGMRLIWSHTRPVGKRHHQVVSSRREKRIVLVLDRGAMVLLWRPFKGWVVVALLHWDGSDFVKIRETEREYQDMPLKRRKLAEGVASLPMLPRDSKTLGKLPDLVAFLTECSYEDMSMRTPGYFTFRNRLHCYEITLYDPDAGLRLALRAPTVDDAFKLADTAVTAEGMPWEIDQYLTDMLAKKSKKKK